MPWLLQVPLKVRDVTVNPGDVAFQDPVNGVVIIPHDKVQQVVDVLPDIVAADERVKQDVLRGMPVAEAFKLHRGK